LPAFWQIRKQV